MENLGNNPDYFLVKDKFIAVEGIDGSGKTSLIFNLVKYFSGLPHTSASVVNTPISFLELLNQKNMDFNVYHQPGGTKVANKIRNILKDTDINLKPQISHELFEIARLDLLLSIQDRKKSGEDSWVICDRHTDSTYAYQATEGVLYEDIERSHERYKNLPNPDVVIFLDISAEEAKKRTGSRFDINSDRFDSKPIQFFKECLDIYHKRILQNRSKYFVVDASMSQDIILNFVLSNLKLLEMKDQ